MDNKDYLDKLIELQKVVKRIDYQISELASEQRRHVSEIIFQRYLSKKEIR